MPPEPHKLRQAVGVVAVSLVPAHRQHSVGVLGIDANHREAPLTKLAPEPGRRRARLDRNARAVRRHPCEFAGNSLRIGRNHPLEDARAGAVDDADVGLGERDVETGEKGRGAALVIGLSWGVKRA